MTRRRDVEGEIYAQLYGEPPEPPADGETRVIETDPRRLGGNEPAEPEAPPPGAFEALRAAAASRGRELWSAAGSLAARGRERLPDSVWARRLRQRAEEARDRSRERLAHSARAAALTKYVELARARLAEAPAPRLEPRGLAASLVAVAVIGLAVVTALGLGSGADGPSDGGPSRPSATQQAFRSVAVAALERQQAAEARRRELERRRVAARERRREERQAARERAEESAESSPQAPTRQLVCIEGAGCFPPGAVQRAEPAEPEVADAPKPTDDEEEESDEEEDDSDEEDSEVDGDSSLVGEVAEVDGVGEVDFD